jgi:hypothetical protein
MQPTYDESSNSDTGSWSPTPGFAPAPPVDTVTKARPWLTALWSFATLLVLIAAAGNQWVVDAVARHSNGNTLGDHLAHLVSVYAWRFNPPGGHDVARTWVAGLAAVGTTLLLTLLLVAVVARGLGRFWQTLFSVWFVVLAATLIGGYVRAAVIDQRTFAQLSGSKADTILFSVLSPGTTAILAGLIVGLIVGFLAAVVAVATRRSNVVAAAPMSFGVPWSRPDDEDDNPWQSPPPPGPTATPSPWSSSDTGRTGMASGPDQTAQLPAVEQSRAADDPTVQHAPPPSTSAPDAGTDEEDDATTQFPKHASPPPNES